MKKIVSLGMMMVLCVGLITGCAKGKIATNNDTEKDNSNITVSIEQEEGKTPDNNSPTNTEAKKEDDLKEEKITIEVAALKGPTAIGMVKVMEDASSDNTVNKYNFTIVGTADEITAKLITGDIQIAAIPSNLASVLYHKTKGAIKVAAINTLGVLSIVESGNTIESIEDLKGKTIYSTGKETTPEYTLNYLLRSASIDPVNDVTIEYKSEAAEVASILSETKNAIAMLPQPYVTTVMMQNDKVRIAFDVTKEWEKLNSDGSTVVTGVVVVNTEFLEENVAAVNQFLDEYEASVDYVNENVEEAAALVEKFDIIKAAVAKNAIPNCNITFIQGNEIKEKITAYLKVLYEQAPKSVGGSLPLDEFYYIR